MIIFHFFQLWGLWKKSDYEEKLAMMKSTFSTFIYLFIIRGVSFKVYWISAHHYIGLKENQGLYNDLMIEESYYTRYVTTIYNPNPMLYCVSATLIG